VAERGPNEVMRMYVIIWESQVKEEHLGKFEKIYSAGGAWAELFQKANGYLGTELLYDSENKQHFITIDRWVAMMSHVSFLSKWKKEYELLDAQCGDMTEHEGRLGKFRSSMD
jgi:hypothetical protein